MRDERELLAEAVTLLTWCLQRLEQENAMQDQKGLFLVTEVACFLKEIGVPEEVARWRE